MENVPVLPQGRFLWFVAGAGRTKTGADVVIRSWQPWDGYRPSVFVSGELAARCSTSEGAAREGAFMPEQPTAGHSVVPVGDTGALGIGNNAGSFLLPSRSFLLDSVYTRFEL